MATLVLLLWLFLAAGFALQAKPTYAHYVISPTTILAVVAVFALVTQASRPDGRRATLAVSLLALAVDLKPSLVEGYLDQARSASPRRMIDVRGLRAAAGLGAFPPSGPIDTAWTLPQVAYGWEAGAFHVYGKRPSCSRYFLSNLVNTPRQRDELGSQVIAGGPAVVVYRPQDADLVVPTYEHESFPWAKVLTDWARNGIRGRLSPGMAAPLCRRARQGGRRSMGSLTPRSLGRSGRLDRSHGRDEQLDDARQVRRRPIQMHRRAGHKLADLVCDGNLAARREPTI